MQKVAKMTVAVASSLSIAVAGFTGLAGASSITNTGPHSWNKVKSFNKMELNLNNNNSVGVSNNNGQNAETGYAGVKHNTTGGDATSGDASNENEFAADVTIDNSGVWSLPCGCEGGSGDLGDIDTTGPKSHNTIESKNIVKVNVTNNNQVSVSNNNSQNASSGDASVKGNTTGGNATSGNASNSNSSSVTLSITN